MSRTLGHNCFMITAFAALALLANSAVLAAPAPQHEEDATAVKPSELGQDEITLQAVLKLPKLTRFLRRVLHEVRNHGSRARQDAEIRHHNPQRPPTPTSEAHQGDPVTEVSTLKASHSLHEFPNKTTQAVDLPAAPPTLLELKQELADVQRREEKVREFIKFYKDVGLPYNDFVRYGQQLGRQRNALEQAILKHGARSTPEPKTNTPAVENSLILLGQAFDLLGQAIQWLVPGAAQTSTATTKSRTVLHDNGRCGNESTPTGRIYQDILLMFLGVIFGAVFVGIGAYAYDRRWDYYRCPTSEQYASFGTACTEKSPSHNELQSK